jgi:hypothetical protein
MSTAWEEMAPDFEFRPAWRLDDAEVEAGAIAFWQRMKILPAEVNPEERAKELICTAWKDGKVIGVQTAALGRLELVRARLAMVRSAVDPEHRRSRVSFAMSLYARDLIERWSMAHPHERVAGLGAIIESREFAGREKQPFWPNTKYGVVGYTPDGRQIRVSWFEDFRFD